MRLRTQRIMGVSPVHLSPWATGLNPSGEPWETVWNTIRPQGAGVFAHQVQLVIVRAIPKIHFWPATWWKMLENPLWLRNASAGVWKMGSTSGGDGGVGTWVEHQILCLLDSPSIPACKLYLVDKWRLCLIKKVLAEL